MVYTSNLPFNSPIHSQISAQSLASAHFDWSTAQVEIFRFRACLLFAGLHYGVRYSYSSLVIIYHKQKKKSSHTHYHLFISQQLRCYTPIGQEVCFHISQIERRLRLSALDHWASFFIVPILFCFPWAKNVLCRSESCKSRNTKKNWEFSFREK